MIDVGRIRKGPARRRSLGRAKARPYIRLYDYDYGWDEVAAGLGRTVRKSKSPVGLRGISPNDLRWTEMASVNHRGR